MVLEPAAGVMTFFSRWLSHEPADTPDSPWLFVRYYEHLLIVFIGAWQLAKVTLFSGGNSVPILTSEELENQGPRDLPMLRQ